MHRWLRYLLLLWTLWQVIPAGAQELPPTQMPELLVLGSHTPYDEYNSAVELIGRTITQEERDRVAMRSDYSYQRTDRLLLSLGNVDKWHKVLKRVVPFFGRYLISSRLDGSAVLPLSEWQKVYLMGYNAERERVNEVLIYSNHIGIDQNLTDGTHSIRLEELLPAIDLFDQHIKILDTKMPTPLGGRWRENYKYYLTDTIIDSGYVAKVVDFVPRQSHAPSLRGRLLIVEDNGPRVLKCHIVFPQSVNINFIDELYLQQQYGRSSGQWRIQKERLNGRMKFFIQLLTLYIDQERTYENYNPHTPDPQLTEASTQYNDWQDLKLITPLNKSTVANGLLVTEAGLRDFMDHFRQLGWQRVTLELADMIGRNYFRTGWDYDKIYGGSMVDIGPIDKIININPVEGVRMQLGARTTGLLSPRHFIGGYMAYGFKDRKVKYQASYAYSFIPKRYFLEEYPRQELSIKYRHDIHTPWFEYQKPDTENLIYDVGVSYLTTPSYRNTLSVEYLHDLSSSIGIRLYANYNIDKATDGMEYIKVNKDHSLQKVPEISDMTTGVELRWAIGERIYKGSMQRERNYANIYREVPVIKLRHEWANKRLGGDFNRHRTELIAEQRLWLGILGRFDYQFTFGKLWSAVPFPILYSPPYNYGLQHERNSFQLLNPLEYVADEWITAFVEYHLRGLIFDRIPHVNKLGLRGVISANLLYGNLTKKNRQETGEELFVLPVHTTEMNGNIYGEIGFGLENLFDVLRVDLYYRVTPLTPYSKSPWGIKAGLSLHF